MREKIDMLTPSSDIFIATAAISDFAPITREKSKISSSFDLSLDFKPVGKIIQNIKKINPDIFLVGFKAEYDISRDEMIGMPVQTLLLQTMSVERAVSLDLQPMK